MFNVNELLFGRIRGMHHVNRYSSIPLINPENVASHSWNVAMLCYAIGQDLRSQGVTVAMEQLLSRAIVHDVSEAVSGDIIRSYKYRRPELTKQIKITDNHVMNDLGNEIGDVVGMQMYQDWMAAKDGLLEGQILALADMLCVVGKCVEEHRMGNRAVNYVLRAMYDDVLNEYHRNTNLFSYVDAVFPNQQWDDPYNRT